jgi:uncharacterized coiled-coil protein SlyX
VSNVMMGLKRLWQYGVIPYADVNTMFGTLATHIARLNTHANAEASALANTQPTPSFTSLMDIANCLETIVIVRVTNQHALMTAHTQATRTNTPELKDLLRALCDVIAQSTLTQTQTTGGAVDNGEDAALQRRYVGRINRSLHALSLLDTPTSTQTNTLIDPSSQTMSIQNEVNDTRKAMQGLLERMKPSATAAVTKPSQEAVQPVKTPDQQQQRQRESKKTTSTSTSVQSSSADAGIQAKASDSLTRAGNREVEKSKSVNPSTVEHASAILVEAFGADPPSFVSPRTSTIQQRVSPRSNAETTTDKDKADKADRAELKSITTAVSAITPPPQVLKGAGRALRELNKSLSKDKESGGNPRDEKRAEQAVKQGTDTKSERTEKSEKSERSDRSGKEDTADSKYQHVSDEFFAMRTVSDNDIAESKQLQDQLAAMTTRLNELTKASSSSNSSALPLTYIQTMHCLLGMQGLGNIDAAQEPSSGSSVSSAGSVSSASANAPEVTWALDAIATALQLSATKPDARASGRVVTTMIGCLKQKKWCPEVARIFATLAGALSVTNVDRTSGYVNMLSGRQIAHILNSLQNFSCEQHPQIRNVLAAITLHIRANVTVYSQAPMKTEAGSGSSQPALQNAHRPHADTTIMTADQLGLAFYGLQNMNSYSVEVRNLLAALTEHVLLCPDQFTRQSLDSVAYGCLNMDSVAHVEMRRLYDVLHDKTSDTVLDERMALDDMYGFTADEEDSERQDLEKDSALC